MDIDHHIPELFPDHIGKLIGGKGEILVMEGILCPINTQRVEGFNRVLKEEKDPIGWLKSKTDEIVGQEWL